MDFDFTQDQQMLRDSVRKYLSQNCTPEFVLSITEQPLGFSREMWKEMAGLDWLGLTFPEDCGGMGLGMVELALVLEEMGRAVFPGPYFASVVLAGQALTVGGDKAQKEKYLSQIVKGDLIATLGVLEQSADWSPESIGLRAEERKGSFVLNGMKRFVPFAAAADVIIVAARTGESPDAISLLLVDPKAEGVSLHPLESIDMTSQASEVRFNNTKVPAENLLGGKDAGWPLVQQVLQAAAVGGGAEMLGCARRALEMSVEYAKVREQFGQPIGAFQAIKHKCAEMLVDVENSHSAVYYAAWAHDAGSPDAPVAASIAKAYAGDAARKACGESIQVHGGIGFTWEFDLHLYFKRAKYNELMYGDTDYHREAALRALVAGNVV